MRPPIQCPYSVPGQGRAILPVWGASRTWWVDPLPTFGVLGLWPPDSATRFGRHVKNYDSLDSTLLIVLVELPGHVLNEVKVDQKWMALDANLNVSYRQSWQETVRHGGKEIGVVMFPLLALNPAHKQSYRPLAGSFWQFMLTRVAMGFHPPVSYSENLPEYFR